ncbi:MAG TPA: zf-HC2 domain-containing protein [Pyrinomonadaceae bacterium]
MARVNASNCRFANDALPYMYGELTSPEASEFELHLLDCTACTDEFAEISNARYEVYEWKKLEFEPLTTPVFEIPYVPASEGFSFVDKIRAAFGGWAVPGGAFAALAVALLTFGPLLWTSDVKDIVVVNSNLASPEPVDLLSDRVVSEKLPSQVAGVPVKKEEEPSQRREGYVDRVPQRNVRAVGSPRPVRSPRPVESKQTSAENQRNDTPTLNDFAEDEDTSLRLAQLFEDIDTSD